MSGDSKKKYLNCSLKRYRRSCLPPSSFGEEKNNERPEMGFNKGSKYKRCFYFYFLFYFFYAQTKCTILIISLKCWFLNRGDSASNSPNESLRQVANIKPQTTKINKVFIAQPCYQLRCMNKVRVFDLYMIVVWRSLWVLYHVWMTRLLT